MNAPAPHLTKADLTRLCEFLYQRSGLLYGESKRFFVERRLAERMRAVGLEDVTSYLALLGSSSVEAEQLINIFTVNETYFYRELNQLECLSQSLLPEIITMRGPGDLIRIWSVPCSTGEEPYSIAVWLLENWPLVDAYNIEIVGSDIDTRVLNAAAEGVYYPRSMSRLPPDLALRYFEAGGERRRIIKDLRESVKFTKVNLMDAADTRRQGRFDIIFCRNVLIYFDDASRRIAARNLFSALVPGGFACLGHSESMTRITDQFDVRRYDNAIVYQRPVA